MRIRIRPHHSIFAFLVVTCLANLPGCAQYGNIQALFTKPELISRRRLAVLGLTPEQEQILMACYTKAFPGQVITFVERNRLHEVISEQDLLQGRLDERTRARIKQIFGVEALIICAYYDSTNGGGGKKLRIRIVDSATGVIIGSVITLAPDNFQHHCVTAVKALKTDLMGANHLEYSAR